MPKLNTFFYTTALVSLVAGCSPEETSDSEAPVSAPAAADQLDAPESPPVAAAPANTIPLYEIATYCESVSQAGGGSYAIRNACVEQENEAREKVSSLAKIEDRIIDYCTQVGAAAGGGSYVIFAACIDQELAARGPQ